MRKNAIERTPAGKYVVPDVLAAPSLEREQYERRFEMICVGLRNTDMAALQKRMGRFFLLFPVAGQSPGSAADMAEAYASVLSAVPLWAVDTACQKVIASGATFRPSAPELRKMADEACRPYFDEADALRQILTAEVYHQNTATERERVKTGFKTLLAEIGQTNGVGNRAKTREECIRDIEAGFPAMKAPLTVSDALRASNEARGMGGPG